MLTGWSKVQGWSLGQEEEEQEEDACWLAWSVVPSVSAGVSEALLCDGRPPFHD